MIIAGGILAQVAAVAALREAQKRESWAVWSAAIALFASSVWLMGEALGWELGITWALITISLAAYGLILHPFLRARSIGHDRAPSTARRSPSAPNGSKWRLTVKLVAAGPLYLIAALGLSLLIATKPWATEITRLFIGGLSSPLFWSIGALHATVDHSLLRVTLAPILIAIFSFGIFYLT